MGLDAHLIHRCTLQRNTGEEPDAYNNIVASWVVVATDVHCRLVEQRAQVSKTESVQALPTATYTLLVLPETDLEVEDRVTDVEYENGSVDTRTFEVSDLVAHRSATTLHKSAVLVVIA